MSADDEASTWKRFMAPIYWWAEEDVWQMSLDWELNRTMAARRICRLSWCIPPLVFPRLPNNRPLHVFDCRVLVSLPFVHFYRRRFSSANGTNVTLMILNWVEPTHSPPHTHTVWVVGYPWLWGYKSNTHPADPASLIDWARRHSRRRRPRQSPHIYPASGKRSHVEKLLLLLVNALGEKYTRRCDEIIQGE